MTLRDVKEQLRKEIKSGKSLLKEYKKESKSINKSGYMIESSGYERKVQIENAIHDAQRFYDLIKNIKRLR